MFLTVLKLVAAALLGYWIVGSDNVRELKDSVLYGSRGLSKDVVKNVGGLFRWFGDAGIASWIAGQLRAFVNGFAKKPDTKPTA